MITSGGTTSLTRVRLRALGSSITSNKNNVSIAGDVGMFPCKSWTCAIGGGAGTRMLSASVNTVCSVSDTSAMTLKSGTQILSQSVANSGKTASVGRSQFKLMRPAEQQSYQLATDCFPSGIGRSDLFDQARVDIFVRAGTDRFVRPCTWTL